MNNIKINNCYGIKNQINVEWDKNIMFFAPNGVGKTRIAKTLKNLSSGIWGPDINGLRDPGEISIKIGENTIVFNEYVENRQITVLDKLDLTNFNFKDNILNFFPDSKSWLNSRDEMHEELIKIFQLYNFDILNIECSIDGILYIMEVLSEENKELNDKFIAIKRENLQKTLDAIDELSNPGILTKQYLNFLDQKIDDNHKSNKENIDDMDIIGKIIDLKRSDHFKYISEKKDISIENAKLKLFKDLNGKMSFEVAKVITCLNKTDAMKDKKIYSYFKHSLRNFGGLRKKIKEQFDRTEVDKIIFNIIKNKKHIENSLNKMKKNTVKLLKVANDHIDSINLIFESNLYTWKLNINNINNIFETPKSTFKFGHDSYNFESFNNFASEGQRTIVMIIAKISNWNMNGILALDDVMSSMDSHHNEEFIGVIKKICDSLDSKKSSIIMLTHSFRLVRDFAFSTGNNFKYCFLDKEEDDKIISFTSNSHNIKEGLKLPVNQKTYNISNLIFYSNILREIISTYLQDESDTGIKLKKLKIIIDGHLRHYKKNVRKKLLLDKLESLEIQMPLFNYLIKILKSDSIDEKFMEQIKCYSQDKEMTTFKEYIIDKVMLGTKLRFLIEEIKYYSSNNAKLIDEWEKSSNKWNIKSSISDISAKPFDYLAHVNNVQWDKIIEMPKYKILGIYKEVTKRGN